jgi:hypothetical protein
MKKCKSNTVFNCDDINDAFKPNGSYGSQGTHTTYTQAGQNSVE